MPRIIFGVISIKINERFSRELVRRILAEISRGFPEKFSDVFLIKDFRKFQEKLLPKEFLDKFAENISKVFLKKLSEEFLKKKTKLSKELLKIAA